MTFSCKFKLNKSLIASNNYKGCAYSLIDWGEAPTDEKAGSVSVCLSTFVMCNRDKCGRK